MFEAFHSLPQGKVNHSITAFIFILGHLELWQTKLLTAHSLLEESGLLVANHKAIPHTFSANIYNCQVVRQFQITVLINTAHSAHAERHVQTTLHLTYVRDIRADCS